MTGYEPLALTISLLLFAERLRQSGCDLEFATHTVLERAFVLAHWSEERKADLYARIVDRLAGKDNTFLDIQAGVTRCLQEHRRTWKP